LDEDPAKYMAENFDPNHFLFHSVVDVASRRGEAKSPHYKVFIKTKYLIPILERCIGESSTFVPVSGKLVSYQKFYAMVCNGTSRKKDLERLEREKKSLSKNNDLTQIEALKQEAISLLEERINTEREEINKRRTALEGTMRNSCKNENEMASFNLAKNTLEFELTELDKEFINKRKDMVEYYDSAKDMRVHYELERKQIADKRNDNKRQKRLESKLNRTIEDNSLVNIGDFLLNHQTQQTPGNQQVSGGLPIESTAVANPMLTPEFVQEQQQPAVMETTSMVIYKPADNNSNSLQHDLML
jgi:hypothetical protein